MYIIFVWQAIFENFAKWLNISHLQVDQEYVLQVAKQIEAQWVSRQRCSLLTECALHNRFDHVMLLFRFSEQVESGLIEVISPPASYYPDMENLRETLGDPPERVRWRTKQNLDFAFLMMYSQPKATFYVQLEDDILAKKNFISTMKNYALQKISEKSPWFVLEFCQLGFIGEATESRYTNVILKVPF